MKLRFVLSVLLLAVSAACSSSPTEPEPGVRSTHSDSATVTDSTHYDSGFGMGSGN